MKIKRMVITTALTAGSGLCAVLAASNSAHAQGGANRRVFRSMPFRSATSPNGYTQNGLTTNSQTGIMSGMAGMRLGTNGAGPGGNRNGGGGQQIPLIAGTIVAGDASTGRILIQSQFSGSNQALQANNSTRFVTQLVITTGDLQTGEFVQVQGVVTSGATGSSSLIASIITAGLIPTFLQQNNAQQNNLPQNNRAAAVTSANASHRTSATPTSAAAQTSNGLTLTGLIISISPLVVELNNGASVTVKTASNAQVNRITPLLFRNLQVGDHLKAMGIASGSGFVLTDVAINM